MTKTIAHAAAFVFAALATTATVALADGAATQQYAAASTAVASRMPQLALQTVVVVGHRLANA